MSEEQPEVTRKKSLLEKYEIPLDHIDFGYIKTCSNVKETERIVKILRSKEEGSYPELLLKAEERLKELDPENRLLRVEGKPLTKQMLDPSQWKQVIDDIQNWSDDFSKKDKALLAEKTNTTPVEENLPPVRKAPKKNMDKKQESSSKGDRIRSFEYDKWDRYDAEAECVRMDVAEETRREAGATKEPRLAFPELRAVEEEASQASKPLSKTEKEVMSNKEKDLGNACYKAGDLQGALRHYTRSIAVFPTPVAYNNRAAAFLKLEDYDSVISDTSLVLQMEPENIKARYRRAQAYQNLKKFKEGIGDLNEILRQDAEHSAAEQLRDKLRGALLTAEAGPRSQSKKVKLMEASRVESRPDEPTPGPSGINTKLLAKQSRDRAPEPHIQVLTKEEKPARKGMRRLEVVEIERDSERRRGRGEGLSPARPRVEVASKYREKASRETGGRSEEQARGVSSLGEELAARGEPASLTHSWEMMSREGCPLAAKAALLRTVRPHLLQAVIGTKLEEKMLSDFVDCLKEEFNGKSEATLITEYLTSIANLERFNIIRSFLPTKVKQVIEDLMDNIGADPSLRKLYL